LGINLDDFRGKVGRDKTNAMQHQRRDTTGSEHSKGYEKRRKTMAEKKDQNLEEVLDGEGNHPKIGDIVPCKYWHLEEMTPTYLATMVLNQIGEQSLTTPNLKSALMGKGKTATSQKVMMEILEMFSGYNGKYIMRGTLRVHKAFVAELNQRSFCRGRRCRDLPLPPNWMSHGIYSVCVMGKQVEITHRFTKKAFEVHDEADMPKWLVADSLYVAENYSETMATLRSREDEETAGILLLRLFPKQIIDQPSIKDKDVTPKKR
jgi:hypothetical protein